MNITFRADASTQIGTGHIMRCLTLADALKEQGACCHFICREHEGHLIDLVKSKGYIVTALPVIKNLSGQAHSYNVGANSPCDSISRDKLVRSEASSLTHAPWLGATQDEDARQTIAAISAAQNLASQTCSYIVGASLLCDHIQQDQLARTETSSFSQPDWLIIDHYSLDQTWETLLAPYTKKILVIDDLADRKHHCHMLLDQNLGKTPAHYQNLVPEHYALLLGPEYALLQSQYTELHLRTPPRKAPIKSILVYFGGSDQYDLTGMTAHAFLQLNRPDILLNVVMGNSYPYKEQLQKLTQTQSNIKLYQNLPSLATFMLQADLAIGAGGSTSWERCCLGLPAIIITLADNQMSIAQELDQRNLARWLGDAEKINIAAIQQALSQVLKEENDLEAWSQRCLSITQGLGAKTLAGYMSLNKHTPLHARLATFADETLLLNWANDQQTRKNSFSSLPITPDQHRHWFHQKLRQPSTSKIYILESEEQLPIGQVRFDWQEEKQAWQVNYVLAPAARGRGLGAKVLKTALQKLNQINNKIIYGEVLTQNQISANIFRRLGFHEANKDGHLTFTKTIGEKEGFNEIYRNQS